MPLPAPAPSLDVQREVDVRTGELWHCVRVLHDVAERTADSRLVRLAGELRAVAVEVTTEAVRDLSARRAQPPRSGATSKLVPRVDELMAGNWPPPNNSPGDRDGNLNLWKKWLPGNYPNLSPQATFSVPWCQVGAMRMICDAVDSGDFSPEGALELLRWCVRTSRETVRLVNKGSRSRLDMAEVLDVSAPELQGASSDDDVIRVLLTHVGGCYPVAELLKR